MVEITQREEENLQYAFRDFEQLVANGTPGAMVESDKFKALGFSWTILLYPRGDDDSKVASEDDAVSVFLHLTDSQKYKASELPAVEFQLTLVCQSTSYESVTESSTETFSPKQDDWGFSSIAAVRTLLAQKCHFLRDGALHVRAQLRLCQPASTAGAADPGAAASQVVAWSCGHAELDPEAAAQQAVEAARVSRARAETCLMLETAKLDSANAELAMLQAESQVKAARAALEEAEASAEAARDTRESVRRAHSAARLQKISLFGRPDDDAEKPWAINSLKRRRGGSGTAADPV